MLRSLEKMKVLVSGVIIVSRRTSYVSSWWLDLLHSARATDGESIELPEQTPPKPAASIFAHCACSDQTCTVWLSGLQCLVHTLPWRPVPAPISLALLLRCLEPI